MPFRCGHHIDFIAFHLVRQNHGGLPRDDPFPQLAGHVVGAVLIQTQLPCDLPIRQVQPPEIQAQQPDSQRLMMARKDSARQVVELTVATPAMLPLPTRLSLVHPPLRDVCRLAMRARHAPRPTQATHRFKTLLIINQRQQRQFHPWLLEPASETVRTAPSCDRSLVSRPFRQY